MPARFAAVVLLALLLINGGNALQATHNSTPPNVGSSRAKLLGAPANTGVPGGIWTDGKNATTTYKVSILPCKPCTTGELGVVQISYKADPSCPSAAGNDLLIGAEYSNGSIESGQIIECTPADNPIVANCSQPAIWTTSYNDTTFLNNTISGKYLDQYWTWNTSSTGQISNCKLDHNFINDFSLTFANSTGACITGTVTRQSQNPTPGSGVGKIPLGNSPTATIGNAGCAITAAAMLLSYMSGITVTNVQLNTWLANNSGYAPNGQSLPDGTPIDDLVNWYAIAYFSTTELNTPLYYTGEDMSGQFNFEVNNYLSQNEPVILVVPGSSGNHFVVATCQAAGSDSYSIDDPGSVGHTQLTSYLGYVTFSTTPPPNYSGFSVTGHSPVQFFLTSPSGNDTGYDPSKSTTAYQIPHSSYYQNSNDYNGTGPAETSIPTLEVRLPANGTYKLDVVGTGTGNYTVDFSVANKSGGVYFEQLKGSITSSSIQMFEFNYSDSSKAQLQIVNVTSSSTQPGSTFNSQTATNSTGSATTSTYFIVAAVVVIVVIVAAGLLFWTRKKPTKNGTH